MATYTGKLAVHATLTANTADTVTLTGQGGTLSVTVRNGAGEAYFTYVVGTSNVPVGAAAGANDNFVIPAQVAAKEISVGNVGGVVVSIISSAAITYSVELLP